MNITTNKLDNANFSIATTVANSDIDAKINKLAKEAGRQLKVDGFRKGKVPTHVVKQMHGEKLAQDAEAEAVREVLDQGSNELGLNPASIIGQPTFKKYEKTEDGIEVEIEVSITPEINLDGYKEIAPVYDKPETTDEEVQTRVDELVEAQSPFAKIDEDRGVEDGDMTLMDFEGSIDGELFEGGKAEGFNLRIGSNQFIPGFEEKMIGMKMGEEKTITVTFPEDYHAKDLAGKDAEFKVVLHEIQAKAAATLDEELAKKLLGGTEDASVEMVSEKVKEQINSEKFSKLYNDELKPKILEALVSKFVFDLPNNIVEQEVDAQVNQKAQSMSPEEIAEYQKDSTKLDELRTSLRDDAIQSVKATFIVDAIAKEEKINVSDDEVSQTIYYEAMMQGQNPQEVIEYYQKNNLIPAVKMGMIEDKLFSQLLDLNN